MTPGSPPPRDTDAIPAAARSASARSAPTRSTLTRRLIGAAKVAAVALVVLLIAAAGATYWLVATPSGSRFALERAQRMLPAGVDLGTPSGRLGGDLELTNVTYATGDFEVKIARLWLRWSPAQLLSGRLSIADAGATGVRYKALPRDAAAPQDADQAPFALPERIALPVAVELQRLSLEDIEAVLTANGESAPLAVTRVLLADASFNESRLEVGRLEIESPLLSATGRAALVAADDYATDARLDWRLRLPDYAELDGQTTVGGTLAALTLDQRIEAPYSLVATGTVRHVLDPDEMLAVALDLNVADLRPSAVKDGLPDATLTAGVRLDGPIDALEVTVRASGNDPAQRQFTAELSATVAPDAVTIRALEVRQPGRDGVLDGSGRIALAGDTSADLSIRWSALQWPLTGEPAVVSPRGTLTFEGPLSGYRLTADARLEPQAAPPVDVRLSGTGNLESVALTLDARERAGTLTGTVNAAWSPSLRAEVVLAAANFDPSPFAADWPGAVDLSVAASGTIAGDDLSAVITRLDAGGTLRGQNLAASGTGRFERAGERYTAHIERLRASLGDTRVEVSGEVAEQANLDWRLASDDLSRVLPEAGGTVEASGRISGPIPRARVAAHVEGRDLAYAEHRVASIDVDADVDLSGRQKSDLTVALKDALVAGTAIGTVSVAGAGTAASHSVSIDIDADVGRAALRAEGALADAWGKNPAWRFTLTEGEVGYGALAPWRLTAPAAGRATAATVSLEPQCWQATEGRMCMSGKRDASGLAADVDLDALSFGYFAGFFPEGIDVRGTVSMAAHASQAPGAALTADATINVSATEVTVPAAAGEDGATTLRIEPSEIGVALNESGATASAALNLEHGKLNLQARATGGAPAMPLAEQSLTGQLELSFPDVSFANDFLTTIDAIQGSLGGTLEFAGTVGAPIVSGAIELANGAVSVPETGVALTAVNAKIEGRGREGVALVATAASGGGELSVDGRMSVPGEPLAARIDIRGNAFQVVDNEEARVFMSPDLHVEASAERLTVTGTVHVPRAELTPGDEAPSAVTVSADQVLLSDEAEEASAIDRELSAEIRVSLGDDVHFDGFGLTARVAGELLVEQEPGTPTTATGELRLIDGEYRAYGQGLVIDSGRIYFAGGPITQPALDVRAVRRPRSGILVGANVQGGLEAPSFELFSEPSMTQQQQLSWLVLGRSLEEAPEGEGNALSQAALAMGLRGGDFLAKNIGARVGLDQFGIETGSGEAGGSSDPSEAALVIGKYLSPKLYVSYGVGLFTPASVLRMQYEISRNWTVVTQSSGEATGGDVLYTVEFGR